METAWVALANATRGLFESAHGRLAEAKEWVLNEKDMIERADLTAQAGLLLKAGSKKALADALSQIERDVSLERGAPR